MQLKVYFVETNYLISNCNLGNGSHGSILFGTVSGSIGALAELSEQDFKFLSLLEKSLKYVIKVSFGHNIN